MQMQKPKSDLGHEWKPWLGIITSVEKNKKCFYKCINSKNRGKENLHSLLDMVGNTVSKGKDEAEVLLHLLFLGFQQETFQDSHRQDR